MDGTLRCARAIFQNGVHFQSCRPNAGFSEAPASDQHRHLWCFGDCRPLLDGNTVQIFISNYAIPSGYKPHSFGMPPEIQQLGPPLPDFSNVKFLPPRTDVVYCNNSGYNLTVSNLPSGHSAFTVKHFRISKSQNLDLVEEKFGSGSTLHLANPLIPGTVELIVVQRK